jgi:hypothetical protein
MQQSLGQWKESAIERAVSGGNLHQHVAVFGTNARRCSGIASLQEGDDIRTETPWRAGQRCRTRSCPRLKPRRCKPWSETLSYRIYGDALALRRCRWSRTVNTDNLEYGSEFALVDSPIAIAIDGRKGQFRASVSRNGPNAAGLQR